MIFVVKERNKVKKSEKVVVRPFTAKDLLDVIEMDNNSGRVFYPEYFEYVKDADSGKHYIKDGIWVADNEE